MILLALAMLSARADDAKEKTKEKHETKPNYILRRQEAYQVRGVPVRRLIIGKREIDIYRDGSAFEGDHRVN